MQILRLSKYSFGMWTIEVPEDASEEEVKQALLEELDFDYIRECITKLNDVIEKYGPLVEVKEQKEESAPNAFVKTYDEKRGWTCDSLESVDSSLVWTSFEDPVNGYSYLANGYIFNENERSIHNLKTWYIADKCFEKVGDEWFSINTEFIIWQTTPDSTPEDDFFYVLDLWEFIGSDNLSDEVIIEETTSEIYYF